MMESVFPVLYILAAAGFILAIKWMNSPATARRGVLVGELGMLLAVVGTLLRAEVVTYQWILIAFFVGSAIGVPIAYYMPMTAVPQRTAFSHACGALAAALIGTAEYYRAKPHGFVMAALMLEILLGVAVALATGAAVFFFLRKRVPVVAAEAVTVAGPMVNLHDESITADQLPESSWLKLAEEWLAKGDCRLALRALYLAGLNYLGERGVVSIRRWKSGLDYKRELERRARAKPEMGVVFTRNVDLFERGWYGRHAVDRGMVEAFVEGMSEIRGYVDGG